jgi:dihydrofolate reductase
MIVAFNAQGIIGKDNKIPWFYKGDLKFFKERTTDHVVVMGRKTWESLPPKMRPLPNRVNIVVTSKRPDEIGMVANDKTMIASSMELALMLAKDNYPEKDVWLIGGRQIYAEGLTVAQEIFITHVPDELTDVEGAVYWPKFTDDWGLQSTAVHPECPELFVAQWVRIR